MEIETKFMTESAVASYGKPEYWEQRYTKDPEVLEWHQMSWAGLKDSLVPLLKQEHKILNVGCGNSRLSEEMYDDGYKQIINIDISNVVIKAMQEKYQDRTAMSFKHMDCRTMDFEKQTFNAVIDKATLDSIVCGESSFANVHKYVSEVSRVLTDDGVFIVISHAQPHYRLNFLDKPEFNWKIETLTVPRPIFAQNIAPIDDKENVYYIYVCRKAPPS